MKKDLGADKAPKSLQHVRLLLLLLNTAHTEHWYAGCRLVIRVYGIWHRARLQPPLFDGRGGVPFYILPSACSTPWLASASAFSLPGSPACPFTQRHSIRWPEVLTR